MKKLIIILVIPFCNLAIAQKDSLAQYANNTITVTLPAKAVIIYASYLSETPNWEDRKTPDLLFQKIGNGKPSDDIITITLRAEQLSKFIIQLMAERYGVINSLARSVFSNVPEMNGYVPLIIQIESIAAAKNEEQGAAEYIIGRYEEYNAALEALYNERYQKGLEWIKN